MARTAGTVVENNFSSGYITEATGLNFPPNSFQEALNVIPEKVGAVSRRLGIDFETNFSTKNIDRDGAAIASYLWKNVNGSPTTQLWVVQIGATLYFWDATTVDPLSTKPIADNIDLTDFSPSGFNSPAPNECQFADGNGLLFVVHADLDAFYVQYDENAQTFTTETIVLKIRDLKGLEDGTEIDERVSGSMSSISNEKKYNLYNQGWETSQLNSWDSSRTDMPSNADVLWSFLDTNNDFSVNQIPRVYRGNSPAPKGHYILDLYNQDRGAASGTSIIPEVLDKRASTVAFYAGRVFYSGIDVVNYNTKIYFSQIVERPRQYGECFQVNDPASKDSFDLLPTDGGMIDIRDCGNIIKIHAIGMGLIIFASNGVWMISGSTGIGFTANDYSIVKISNTSALTNSSFVEVQGTLTWWNLDGIYILKQEGTGGQTTSITEGKIKKYYNRIPSSAKRRATGFYNTITGVVQWLYRVEESATPEELYETQYILNFDTNTGAFYIWKPADSEVKIHSVVVLEHRGGEITVEDVVDESDVLVVDDNGNPVFVYSIENAVIIPKFKYLCSYSDGSNSYEFTIAEAWAEDYLDWSSYDDGVDYPSYFISGYGVRGEASKDFQNNYVTFYSDNNSTYYVQGNWDYANSGDSGRWTQQQLVETEDKEDYDYVYSKRKIRGSGKAVQIKINSVPNKPFRVIGWSVNVVINTVV